MLSVAEYNIFMCTLVRVHSLTNVFLFTAWQVLWSCRYKWSLENNFVFINSDWCFSVANIMKLMILTVAVQDILYCDTKCIVMSLLSTRCLEMGVWWYAKLPASFTVC